MKNGKSSQDQHTLRDQVSIPLIGGGEETSGSKCCWDNTNSLIYYKGPK